MLERILSPFILVAKASGEVPAGRVFALDGQTFIGVAIQIINIIIIFAVLYKLLYGPVKDILNKRKERIKKQLDEAQSLEEEAQALINEYKEKLSGVDEERQRIINEAKKDANEEKDRIIAKAEKEAAKIKEDAIKSLETERQLLQRNTKDYVIELSALLSEKTLKDSVNPEIQDEHFEESLKELEVTSWKD